MKCPICNDGKIITYLDGTYECDNPECSIYNGTHTETFEALIRTRKALEIAVDALKNMNEIIKNYEYGNGLYYALDGHDTVLIAEYVEKALCQITALEQKE